MATIRPVVAADLPSIHRIYSHEVLHGTATYEYVPPGLADMRARVQSIVDAGYPFFVAEAQERVVGYAYASAYRNRDGYRWTVEDSVYVDPDLQGRGIGRALLECLIERCTQLGYRRMIALIGDASNASSIVLHERLGFAITGRFPGLGRKHGRWLENVQMLRTLGADGGDPDPPLPARD